MPEESSNSLAAARTTGSGPITDVPPTGPQVVPAYSPHHVPRPRLIARLDSVRAPVTVVSAPTGWGKTTLLASWVTGQRGRALRVADGDRAGFWPRVLSAIADLAAPESADAVTAADGPRRLSEALRHISAPLTIVVDDCNDVAGPDELAGLAQAVRTAGGHARLILACRGDPAFPVHRWRVDGRLAEISREDLAFTVDETADLFAGHGVTLPWLAVAELHARAEGWAAGLRLAAMALQHNTDPAQILAGPASIEAVGDYLAAEVLSALDPRTRRVLAEVSVAERLTPGLVNALTDRVDGAALLADLQRRDAFVMRCAGTADTYRLHPMFGRALYPQLGRDDQNQTVQAHHRAADWYLAQGPPAEALRHLLAAGEWERAVAVLNRHWPDLLVGSRHLNLTTIVASRPDGDPPRRLWLAMAAERLDAGDAVAMRHLLRLAAADEAGRPPADDESAEPGGNAGPCLQWAFQLAAAKLDGDLEAGRAVAAEILSAPEPIPKQHAATAAMLRPLALLSLGAAELQAGQLPAAGRHLRDALLLARRRDMGHAEISATSHLAAWHAARGDLRDAARCAAEAAELAQRLGLEQVADLGWGRLAVAEAYFQWDRLDDSGRCADAAVDNSCGDRLIQLWGTILQARIRIATGRLEDAHRVLRAARREMDSTDLPAPVRRALSLVDGELRLACGDLAAAHKHLESWDGAEALTAPAAVLQGSLLLAEGRPGLAAAVVAPHVADPAETTSRTYRASAGLISALAAHGLGHREQAIRGLDVALEVAEEEDLRRCFTAAGHPVRALMESVAPMMLSYPPVVAALTATLSPAPADEPEHLRRTPAGSVPAGSLIQPLTSRELTVLRYLQGTLSHVEIAGLLYISVNTVKTHVKNIYSKLGTSRRRDAIQRGHELRLL
ncbi:MAG TPA: LuxR C-terminal-related transcriptional regulator [Actinoplanes sp.]|nr:LuxR C-terminal-related transcriptional regulator [Actinoplanes sp.]